MRKSSLLFASLLFATSLFAQTPPATTGDDLAQALVNHGMDPASAPTFAAVLELAISQSNALSQRITDAQTAATAAKLQADATQATASDLQTRMANAENMLNSVMASLGSISTTLATTQNQAATAATQAQGAMNQVTQLDTNVSVLNSSLAAVTQRVAILEQATAPPPPPPPPALIHVEAETAASIPAGNVISLATASGGKYVGNIAAGQTFTYTVAVPAAGNYLLSASIASPVATAQFHFAMNGVSSPVITIPSTGGYTIFKPVSAPQLATFTGPATVTLQIVANTTQFNVDFFELAKQ